MFTKHNYDHKLIKRLRSARGVTQKEIEQFSGVSQSQLSKIEKGDVPLDDATVECIADFLNVTPAAFISGPQSSAAKVLQPLYRAKKSVGSNARNQIQNTGDLYRRQALMLESYVDCWHPHSLPDFSSEQYSLTPEEAANHTRAFWQLGKAPIESMCVVLESAGIRVLSWSFADRRIDAFTFIADGDRPTICFNRDLPGERIRFSLAHELGHLILHSDTLLSDDEVETDVIEGEANAFASAFLLPAHGIRTSLYLCNRLEDYFNLKQSWLVSAQAIVRRAFDLGIISNERYGRLMRTITSRGWRRNEPKPFPPERPVLSRELLELLTPSEIREAELVRSDEIFDIFVAQPTLRLSLY